MPPELKIVNHFSRDMYYTVPYRVDCMDEDMFHINHFEEEKKYSPHYETMYSKVVLFYFLKQGKSVQITWY